MLSVDRIEGGFAVCTDGSGIKNIPISEISGAVKEGDILKNRNGVYTADKEATRRRREEIIKKQNELWE